MGIEAYETGILSEVILMQSTVMVIGLGSNPRKRGIELTERIAKKEKEGWEVVDMRISPPAFGSQPLIILLLARKSN